MPKSEICLLVIGLVEDAPNQIRYQRVVALAKRFTLHVVTTAPLPLSLDKLVARVHVVAAHESLWMRAIRVAKHNQNNTPVIVHTVYAPRAILAGFFCKFWLNCRWVYDIYDHPSLTWSGETSVRRILKILVWHVGIANLIRSADVWVIGMHPGILSYLPRPRSTVRLVVTDGPGVIFEPVRELQIEADPDMLSLCYAGPITMRRGLRLIYAWAESYEGPPVTLHLMGFEDSFATAYLDTLTSQNIARNLHIIRHGWTDHRKVSEIMKISDIGICPVDPDIINYRFAYPIKIVEYMSRGIVPVATDGYGVRSFIHHGKNGFVSKYSARNFADALNAAISVWQDKDKFREMKMNALNRVQFHDQDTLNRRLIDFLDAALSESE